MRVEQGGRRFRALVVDDSTTMQRLMDIMLGQLDMEVEFADRGSDAIALAQKRSYDMVFLDIILPDIDGYRVCKTLKANARTKSIPVIMLTSRDTTFDKVRGKMAGADAYLIKPMERTTLMQTIRAHLPQQDIRPARATAHP